MRRQIENWRCSRAVVGGWVSYRNWFFPFCLPGGAGWDYATIMVEAKWIGFEIPHHLGIATFVWFQNCIPPFNQFMANMLLTRRL